jgi:hypothetical protein
MIHTQRIAKIELPEGYPDSTRVWIYQADRKLGKVESEKIAQLSQDFVASWTAHNQQLKATTALYYDRFLCLFADESIAGASGCSIDKSVHFVQQLEQLCACSFTNRMLMTYRVESGVEAIHLHGLPAALKSGDLNLNTPVFDNLVASLGDMRSRWMVPLSESWFMRFA